MRKLLMLIGALIMCDAYGEDVYWFENGTDVTKTNCESGNNISIPADTPQKTGFRFIGWEILTEPTSWRQMLFFPFTSSTPTNSSSTTGWSITSSYGKVQGTAACSSIAGSCTNNYYNCTTLNNEPTAGAGHCWCHAYNATFGTGSENIASTPWIFISSFGGCTNTTSGRSLCAYMCGSWFRNQEPFRVSILGL